MIAVVRINSRVLVHNIARVVNVSPDQPVPNIQTHFAQLAPLCGVGPQCRSGDGGVIHVYSGLTQL